jgi:RNA polymerase sigma-70 factor (ECF subfamily)
VDEPLSLVRKDAGRALTIAAGVGVESFEAFVTSSHPRLYGALCLLTRDRFEAEEIAQEAFVRIFERWERVRAVEDPTGYLFRTAMNVFRKRYRRATLAVRRAAFLARRDDDFEQIEDRDVVVRAVAALPADQRAALVVTSLLGYPSEEAARILGIKPSTVRARATRARAALREAIGEER